MDITVYLPDEIGTRAKEAELPFSRMLRDAVEAELERRAAVEQTLSDGVSEHEVELEDGSIGVITGKFLGVTDTDDKAIYLTDDGRVLVYDTLLERVARIEDPETELAEWLQNSPRDSEVLAGIMRSLGFRPRVRL